MNQQAKCPQCRKPSSMSPENVYRPFCSERCQLIDLGAWATGKYAIAAEIQTPTDDENELEQNDLSESKNPLADAEGDFDDYTH